MPARNVVHFDVDADDLGRARRFYEEVFGWRFNPWGPPNFFLIATGDESDPGIHGALRERPDDGEKRVGFECTIAVDDVDAAAAAIEKAGGKILVPKHIIPTVGELIQFMDTEGNIACAMRYYDRG